MLFCFRLDRFLLLDSKKRKVGIVLESSKSNFHNCHTDNTTNYRFANYSVCLHLCSYLMTYFNRFLHPGTLFFAIYFKVISLCTVSCGQCTQKMYTRRSLISLLSNGRENPVERKCIFVDIGPIFNRMR